MKAGLARVWLSFYPECGYQYLLNKIRFCHLNYGSEDTHQGIGVWLSFIRNAAVGILVNKIRSCHLNYGG